jgi:hypothetical protein
MKSYLVSSLSAFFLPIAALHADESPGSTSATLSGTYVLVEHPKGVEAPDRIAFHPDGSCAVDMDGQNGVAGKYHTDADGNLTIERGGGNPNLTYHFNREKITLILSNENQDDFYYGLLPDHPPHIGFSDLVGIVSCHNEAGDSVAEITPDHRFHDRLHELSCAPGSAAWLAAAPQDRVCYDLDLDGTCSYSGGVISYVVEHCRGSTQDQSLADVVIKHDDKGLWLIDPYHDKVICQPPAKTLDLPPPPPGYREVTTSEGSD